MKNTRFLKKALHALPKLSKNALLKFCENLLHEHYNLLGVLDEIIMAVRVCDHDNKTVYENSAYDTLSKEFHNLSLFQNTGVTTIIDNKKNDRIFYIKTQNTNQFTIRYFMELTDILKDQSYHQESLQALETLAAGISHEIKNPLSAIDIHTYLIQKKINSNKIRVQKEVKDYIDIVKEESSRLLHVLDMFLNMTRKSQPELVFTETADVAYKAYKLLEPELNAENIKLRLEINSVPKIFTSPDLLQQILLDLLRNSMEALKNQNDKMIELGIKENDSKTHIIISVDDSGSGIESGVVHKIFDPYFTTKDNGTGLGLTLVKKMIEELNGKILVSASNLHGAKFDIYLPISADIQKLLS